MPPSAPWAPPAIRVTGEMEFQNAPAPVQLDNLYAADNGSAAQVSLSTAVPLAYVMQSGFGALALKRVGVSLGHSTGRSSLRSTASRFRRTRCGRGRRFG